MFSSTFSFPRIQLTSFSIESQYCWVDVSGFVSSKRKTHFPSNSLATPKFNTIDFACPICRYPDGSGGNLCILIFRATFSYQLDLTGVSYLVCTRPLNLPSEKSFRIIVLMKFEDDDEKNILLLLLLLRIPLTCIIACRMYIYV